MNKETDRLEEQLVQLGERLSGSPSVVDHVMSSIEHAKPTQKPKFNHRRAIVVMSKPRNLVATAAVLAIVLLGFGPWTTNRVNDTNSWWLTPPTVWAGELQSAIDKASRRGYFCREQLDSLIFGASSTSSMLFVAGDRYRRDIYEQGKLRESQWYAHGANGLTMTSVRYGDKSYTITLDPKAHREGNPMERMKSLSKQLNKLGKRLGSECVDGRDAVGFEIDSKKIDTSSDKATVIIWLDKATKMPLKIESMIDGFVLRQTEFTWNAKLPAGTFEPDIPDGFTKVERK